MTFTVSLVGAPVTTTDINGFTPLHLAVQMNNFECIMVLLNIGVDCNASTLSGYTPLYLSIATGSRQAESLLRERGARLHPEHTNQPAGSTILDVPISRVSQPSAVRSLEAYLNLPNGSSQF